MDIQKLYQQGYMDKVAELKKQADPMTPSRAGSYLSSLPVVPFGAPIYGALHAQPGRGWEGAARGALYGIGGTVAGGLGGSAVGSGAGLLADAIAKAVTKGKYKGDAGNALMGGSLIGTTLGGLIGGGEGTYRAAKRVHQKPMNEKAEQLKHRLKGLIGK